MAAEYDWQRRPEYAQFSPQQRKDAVLITALNAATFEDPETEQRVKGFATQYVLGNKRDKQINEFFTATTQASGLLGLVDRYILNGGSNQKAENRQRALDFYKTMDSQVKGTDFAAEAGAVVGTLLDILGVNLIMGPATGAARAGIQVAARGGSTAIQKAAALGKAAPIIKRGLNFFGPIASEAAIEAIPYFLVEEQRRASQGQPSVASGGALEIAKTLGLNAALDFAVGSVALSALSLGAKTGKAIFKRGRNYDDVLKNLASDEVLLHRLAVGIEDPVILAQLPFESQALYKQRAAIQQYIRKGATDPDSFVFGRDAFVAHDLKKILVDVPQPNNKHAYQIIEFADNGRSKIRNYPSLRDAEDYLSFEYFKSADDYAREILKTNPNMTYDDALLKSIEGRPDHLWAIKRGKILQEQGARLDPKEILDPSALMQEGLKSTPKWYRVTLNRPFASKGEASALVAQNSDNLIAIPAKIDLSGKIVSNVDAAGATRSSDITKGLTPLRVKVDPEPNALLIGNRAAPPELYASMDELAPKAFSSGYYNSLEEARASLMLNQGFDHFRHPDGSVEFFTMRNMKLIGTIDDIVAPIHKATQSGSMSTASIMSEKGKAFLKSGSVIKNDKLLTESAVTALRSRDADQIAAFGNMYVRGLGYEPKGLKVEFTPGYKNAGVTLKDDIVTLNIPRAYKSYSDEVRQLGLLFRGLNDLGISGDTSKFTRAVKSADFYQNIIKDKPLQFGFPAGVKKDSWLTQAADSLGYKLEIKGNSFTLIQDATNSISFNDIDDAVTYIARKSLDDNAIMNELLAEGIRVRKNPKTGEYVARSINQGQILSIQNNLEDLMKEIDYVPRTMDKSFGAKVIEIRPDGIEFEFGGVTYLKNQEHALRLLSKFDDHKLLSQKNILKVSEKGDLSVYPNGQYHVYNKNFDFHKDFDSIAEARKFFEGDLVMNMENLSELANRKFLDFWADKGEYVIRDFNGNIQRASTLEELQEVFKKYPDISQSAPELIPLDPEVEVLLPDIARQFKLHTWEGKANPLFRTAPELPEFSYLKDPVQLNALETMKQFTSETFGYFDSIAQKHDVKPLAEFKNRMILGFREIREASTDSQVYLRRAFTGPNGKLLPEASRHKIFYHLASEPGSLEATSLANMYSARYKKSLEALTPDEAIAADKLREFYKVLGDKFGIDFRKLIHDYMPRLREKYTGDLMEIANSLKLSEFAQKAVPEWGNGVPKEIKFWAENARTSELPQYFLKDDALEVALMYSAQGHKKQILNPIFQEVTRFVEESGSRLDPIIGKRLAIFQQDIMGSNVSNGERIISDFGRKFFKELKNGPLGKLIPMSVSEMEDIGSNIMNNVMSTTYFSSMGFKPWLAIRNSFQTDTMLAMRVGGDWTYKAKKEVLNNYKKWVDIGYSRGILNEKAPIVNLVYTQGKLGKVAEKSFEMFKNSDDYTRLVAYASGNLRMENAITALRINPSMTQAKFLEMSGIDRFNPVHSDQVWELTQKGLAEMNLGTRGMVDAVTGKAGNLPMPETSEFFEAAKDLYGNLLQRSTMFDYTGASSPLMFRGVVGKLFGQFGTYSAGFRANIAEAMRYGTTAQKAGSIATYLGFTSAYWAAFEAMGIRTNDFKPFAPGLFGGGPLFDIMVNAANAGDTGYEGDRARAALARDMSALVPGATQTRYLKRAIEYAQSGDTAKAIMALGMIPMYSE
jgi:hypothetical protein